MTFSKSWNLFQNGYFQRSIAPSALTLTIHCLLGQIFNLVMSPLWPWPTCVMVPSSYFQTWKKAIFSRNCDKFMSWTYRRAIYIISTLIFTFYAALIVTVQSWSIPVIRMFHCLFIVLKILLFSYMSYSDQNLLLSFGCFENLTILYVI